MLVDVDRAVAFVQAHGAELDCVRLDWLLETVSCFPLSTSGGSSQASATLQGIFVSTDAAAAAPPSSEGMDIPLRRKPGQP